LSNDTNLGLLMFVAYRAMESAVLADLAAAGFDDITLAQARVFQRINADGSRLTELAEAAQVTKQTAGFLVDQLEAARYVRRAPDPSDRRARLVVVAPRGRRAVEVAARTVRRVEAEWTEHLGVRRTQQLREALEALREITDPYG
jgi:DNA-binding MarR family transcriptional regulator